jgi:hypothetical protein
MANKLKGTKIVSVTPHYENIYISVGNGKGYFITSEELVKVLSEFDFYVEPKRTRSWLHIEIDEWKVERFDEPRTY